MILKLQNGDKLKIESDNKREARRKYKEHSQLSIGQKLKRNLNIASNFLKSGPNITNFGNAVSALFGGYSPEDPDLHYGEAPAVGIKNFENLVRTARVAREFNDVVKGPVNQFRLLNNFIEKLVTNPKGSGKLIHYDKGNGKSVFQENRGASIINGKLIPGKTKREGQKNYTWWNTDNPYINVHKAKEGPLSPTRYVVVDNNSQFLHPFDIKEPVGQSAGKGRGFILSTERVTDKPVDLTNAEIYEKSPFGWWERIKVQPTVNGPVNIFQKSQKEAKHILKMNSSTEDELTYSIPLYYPEKFTKPYIASEKTKSIVNNIVFPRLQQNRPNINVGENFDFGNIYKLPWQIFEKAGEKSEGFFNKKTGKIVRRDLSNYYTNDELDSHELRHRIASKYPYTKQEQNIVKEAFEGFKDANINKVESGYPIEEEIPTTINDARNKLLFINNDKLIEGHWVSPEKYIEDSGTQWYDLSLEDQNRLINEASPSEIIYSYHSSNDYGKNLIEYLESNNLLNQSRLEKLRKALFIGSTIPFLIPRKEEKK